MLARDASGATASVALLTVEVAGQRCALLASDVVEIQRAVAVARLPRCPAIVEGAINVRGRLVPVLDVRSRFGLPAEPLAPSNHFVLVRLGGAQAGGIEVHVAAIRVDRALDLVSVRRDRIDDARSAVPGVEFVGGIAKLDDGLVVIYDLETFLSTDESRELGAALSRARSDG
jgi:purine-binding chemotaxis protein CheW